MRNTRIVEMLEVTEAAALAAGRWMGKGDKHAADDAAVEGMRTAFNDVDISGTIVIGEGERDEAPMLFIGEKVGKGGEEIDIAVDPLEGTNLTAYGQSNSLAVLAFGPKGTLLHAPDTYMKKIAVGPEAATAVHIDASPTENITNVAKALKRDVDIDASPTENITNVAKASKRDVEDLVVCILERDRHIDLIREVRQAGARIRLISDGDVFGAVATAIEGTGIHLYLGTGAAPEGVLACTAMKCLGGCFMGRFEWRSAEEKSRAVEMGTCNIDDVLTMDCLVNTDEAAFIATGVTDGEMLRGVKYFGSGARTNSVAMDAKSKTVRFTDTIYRTGVEKFWVRMD
jgi:fructose-1,6-bisphosphatase/sedoheptulose 1,7-bisphosphatase-like protein